MIKVADSALRVLKQPKLWGLLIILFSGFIIIMTRIISSDNPNCPIKSKEDPKIMEIANKFIAGKRDLYEVAGIDEGKDRWYVFYRSKKGLGFGDIGGVRIDKKTCEPILILEQ